MTDAGFSESRMEEAVADGLAILRFSVLMATKNRLIVGALREGRPYDADRARSYVREELAGLADEQHNNAEITTDALVTARTRRGRKKPAHERDYRPEDVGALTARAEIYQRIAARMVQLRDDESYLDELAEEARRAAWDELGAEVSARLAQTVTEDSGYVANRELRIRYLKEVDLRMLARERRRGRRRPR